MEPGRKLVNMLRHSCDFSVGAGRDRIGLSVVSAFVRIAASDAKERRPAFVRTAWLPFLALGDSLKECGAIQ